MQGLIPDGGALVCFVPRGTHPARPRTPSATTGFVIHLAVSALIADYRSAQFLFDQLFCLVLIQVNKGLTKPQNRGHQLFGGHAVIGEFLRITPPNVNHVLVIGAKLVTRLNGEV